MTSLRISSHHQGFSRSSFPFRVHLTSSAAAYHRVMQWSPPSLCTLLELLWSFAASQSQHGFMLLRPRPSTVLDRCFYKLVQPSIVRDDQAVPPSVTSLTRAILRLIIMCTYSPNRPTSRTKRPYHLLAVLYETMLLLIDVGWRTHACSPSPHACRVPTHAALVDATSLVMRITPACIPQDISRLVADLVGGF